MLSAINGDTTSDNNHCIPIAFPIRCRMCRITALPMTLRKTRAQREDNDQNTYSEPYISVPRSFMIQQWS
jgi:hypothetical protein